MMCPNLAHVEYYKLLKVDWVGVEPTTSAIEKVEHEELEDIK